MTFNVIQRLSHGVTHTSGNSADDWALWEQLNPMFRQWLMALQCCLLVVMVSVGEAPVTVASTLHCLTDR